MSPAHTAVAHAAVAATDPVRPATTAAGHGKVPSPRTPHRPPPHPEAPGRHRRPRELTLVDDRGHFCDTWRRRGGNYLCACPVGGTMPADELSAAKVRAALYLTRRLVTEGDVITWERPSCFERLVDPNDATYVSDTFFHYRDEDVWVSAEGRQILGSRYEEARNLAAQYLE